jgi:hypothetical protein
MKIDAFNHLLLLSTPGGSSPSTTLQNCGTSRRAHRASRRSPTWTSLLPDGRVRRLQTDPTGACSRWYAAGDSAMMGPLLFPNRDNGSRSPAGWLSPGLWRSPRSGGKTSHPLSHPLSTEVFQGGHRSGDRNRGHNAQGSRAVEGGVRSLNPSAQKPCWSLIPPHSTCPMRSSSGSRCSSSPARVTAAANSRRTNVPWSLWCTCASTSPSRRSPPARHLHRHRTRLSSETTVGGCLIKPGTAVHKLLGAANRDPARYTEPDTFNIRRGEGTSLAFSAGPHYCIWAALGRLEADIAFSALLQRFSTIQDAGWRSRLPSFRLGGYSTLRIIVGK